MYKSKTTYHVGKNDYLDKVFKEKILPSGFIDKGRCGIGGTTMEILYTGRCSIITVPNISIIESKKEQHPQLDIVYGAISQEEVFGYLLDRKQGQKIITTPEGLRKIMWAAEQVGRTEEFMNEWFLMLDEAHTFITEDYRPEILIPFRYFFDWKNKCIITATPYHFSHPRMAELDYHKVVVNEKLSTVTLVNAQSVLATLDYTLKHIDEFPSNVHIFYNSVTEIANAIRRANLADCNIFCADDKEHSNLKKLGEFERFYCEKPSEQTFKKINFYTSKYFEGWDMYEEQATLIVVTDVHKDHTKIGVADKALQAFGRLRGKKGTSESPSPFQLIHITNTKHIDSMKTKYQFQYEFTYSAKKLISQNNEDACDTKFAKSMLNKNLDKLADIDKDTKTAKLNYMKLDQQINEASKNECYNHIDFVQEAWLSKYSIDLEHSKLTLETKTVMKRKSASTQFKEDYHSILDHKQQDLDGGITFCLGDTVEQKIKGSNPLAYEAARLIDPERVKELNYSISKIKAELILKGNELAEVKLLRLLNQHFKIGKSYTNEIITSTLQKLYDQLEVKTQAGKIRTAKPAQIGEHGRFEISECKPKNSKGDFVNGYTILRKQFQIQVAA